MSSDQFQALRRHSPGVKPVSHDASLRSRDQPAEEHLRAIAEYTFDWESWIGLDGKPKWINAAVERMTGMTVADCMGMSGYPYPIIHPGDRERMRIHLRDAEQGRSGNDVIFRIERRDGTLRWASMSWQPLAARDGTPLGYRASIRDITDRKLAEDALRDREKHLRFALEASLAVIFEWDIRNDRVRRIMSSTNALPETHDELGRFEDVVAAVHPEDRAKFRAAVESAMASETGRYHSVYRVVDPDGAITWLEEFGGVEFDSSGQPLRFLGIAHNINERKRAEERLCESEERHRQRAAELEAILDTAPIGLAIADATGRHIRGNRANEEIFGLKPGAEFSVTAPEPAAFRVLCAGQDLGPHDLPMQRAVKGETVVGRELEVITPEGHIVSVYASAKPLMGKDGRPRGAVGAFVDISARKRTEDSLKSAHETFRNLVEHSPFGIYIVDADFRLIKVSDGARKVFEEVHPLIGRDFADVMRTIWSEPFATEAIQRFRHTLETGEPYRAPRSVERRADIDAMESYDWKIERIMLDGGRHGVVCHFYDISERLLHEEHTKMLMREINHRSKNMLSLVQSIATLTISASTEDFVKRFSERIKSLAASHDLLVEGQWKSVQVRDLVRSQLSHFADLIGGRIEAAGPPLSLKPHVAQSIGMALHELATNAAKHGALSNEYGRVSIFWTLEPGDGRETRYHMCWIERGGPPVEPPNRCGFGTNVTTSVVKMSVHGDVSVDYKASGLEWRLSCAAQNIMDLPSSGMAGGRQPVPISQAQQQQLAKRILVVEDEPLIAMEMSAVLTAAGFQLVGPAANVSQALALLEGVGCDAAMLDVNLGKETSDPITRRLSAANVPFIAISGYRHDQLPQSFTGVTLHSKPVNTQAIIESLKHCLMRKAQ